MLIVNPRDQRSLATLASAVAALPTGEMVGLLADLCGDGLFELRAPDGGQLSEVVGALDDDARIAACLSFFRAEPQLAIAVFRRWLGFLVAGNYHQGGYDDDEMRKVATRCGDALGDAVVLSAVAPPPPPDRTAAEVGVPSLSRLWDAAALFAPRRPAA